MLNLIKNYNNEGLSSLLSSIRDYQNSFGNYSDLEDFSLIQIIEINHQSDINDDFSHFIADNCYKIHGNGYLYSKLIHNLLGLFFVGKALSLFDLITKRDEWHLYDYYYFIFGDEYTIKDILEDKEKSFLDFILHTNINDLLN